MISTFGTTGAVGKRYSAKRRGHGLSGIVVAHPLEKRVPDAVRDTANDLSLDDHRVDQAAGVVDHEVTGDPDSAGADIHVDLDDMHAVTVSEARGQEVDGGFQSRRHVLRPRVAAAPDRALATSANDTERPGTPATEISPFVNSRS